jgi:superfamily II DNA helicase RecQ
MGAGVRIKLFTLRYTATLGGFDERPLQEFARDKEVVAFREHFFSVNDVPHLTCVLTWQDAVVDGEDRRIPASVNAAAARRARPRRGADGPDADMSETDRLLFNRLREWRCAKARAEGVPPYVLFTNRELVEIVARRPGSANALAQARGVGAAKVERHGAEVLAIVNGQREPEATA